MTRIRSYHLVCAEPLCLCLELDDVDADACACRSALAGTRRCLECGAPLEAFELEAA